jgi:hypothetical protein
MPEESFPSAIKRSLELSPKLSKVAGSRILTFKDWEVTKRELSKSERKSMLVLEGKKDNK